MRGQSVFLSAASFDSLFQLAGPTFFRVLWELKRGCSPGQHRVLIDERSSSLFRADLTLISQVRGVMFFRPTSVFGNLMRSLDSRLERAAGVSPPARVRCRARPNTREKIRDASPGSQVAHRTPWHDSWVDGVDAVAYPCSWVWSARLPQRVVLHSFRGLALLGARVSPQLITADCRSLHMTVANTSQRHINRAPH